MQTVLIGLRDVVGTQRNKGERQEHGGEVQEMKDVKEQLLSSTGRQLTVKGQQHNDSQRGAVGIILSGVRNFNDAVLIAPP